MKILFLCVANSVRSQMAEAIARMLFGKRVSVYSAGSKPTLVNPFTVRVLDEIGVPTDHLQAKSITQLPKGLLEALDYVVTLCSEDVCPASVTKAKKLRWPLPDPAGKPGKEQEQLVRFRSTRDEIKRRLEAFAKDNGI